MEGKRQGLQEGATFSRTGQSSRCLDAPVFGDIHLGGQGLRRLEREFLPGTDDDLVAIGDQLQRPVRVAPAEDIGQKESLFEAVAPGGRDAPFATPGLEAVAC